MKTAENISYSLPSDSPLRRKIRIARMVSILLFIAAVLALLIPVIGKADQSTAQSEKSQAVTLAGSIREYQFTHPDAWLQIDAVNHMGAYAFTPGNGKPGAIMIPTTSADATTLMDIPSS